ncbi:hypothetical protein K438DRAFT_1759398 [Mycena galopus ATCC 62051]|nr:hypothetical protein K438DRAFT_1759398 [Mycena galopus ATCC 62051]
MKILNNVDRTLVTNGGVSDFYDPEINGFLHRTTLIHLSTKGRDHTLDHVDPNALPALTNIDVFDAHQPFNRFLACLPAENRVAVITLITYGVTYDKHFESLLLRRSMPALNHVTIQVLEKPPDLESSHPSPPHAKTIRNYEAAFLTLHARGLLSVEFIPLHCQPMLLEMPSERLHRGRA